MCSEENRSLEGGFKFQGEKKKSVQSSQQMEDNLKAYNFLHFCEPEILSWVYPSLSSMVLKKISWQLLFSVLLQHYIQYFKLYRVGEIPSMTFSLGYPSVFIFWKYVRK